MRWTFISGHPSEYYYQLISYLTPLSNLLHIICIIKKYLRWKSVPSFFDHSFSSHYYLLTYLTILINLFHIICITKKNPGLQSPHTTPFFFGYRSSYHYPVFFLIALANFLFTTRITKKKLDISNLIWNFACNAESGLVIKKKKSPKTFLYLFLDAFQLSSLMISLTLSKMRPSIFEHLAMLKCTSMFAWQLSFKCTLILKLQFSLTMASFALLADSLSVKLTGKASSNFSCPAQTIA